MIKDNFKKPFTFSVLSHLFVFGLFSFSFGYKIPQANYAQVYFLGRILNPPDLISRRISSRKIPGSLNKNDVLKLKAVDKDEVLKLPFYRKPKTDIVLVDDKGVFIPQDNRLKPALPVIRRKASVMFYPRLPYNFLLYFKDRQVAHIELAYKLNSSGDGLNIVDIRRRVSSGSLEVDLLSMRYISQYLSIQKMSPTAENWQTVRIELKGTRE